MLRSPAIRQVGHSSGGIVVLPFTSEVSTELGTHDAGDAPPRERPRRPRQRLHRRGRRRAPCDTADPTPRTIIRVVDGDTVVLNGGEKVRLIGVDTPETVDPRKPVQRFGHEASAFTTRRLQGKTVRLAYDWQRTDKYRRTLAYVCLPDGELVNETIIRQGYGVALMKYPFAAPLMARFRAAEAAARTGARGLWAPAVAPGG